MEWRNDILSFSGFDYGVSEQQKLSEDIQDERKTMSDLKEVSPLEDLDDVELEDSIKRQNQEVSNEKGCENVEYEECDFDPMTERKIENNYFLNIEQAERKMKKLATLKSKWSEPWQTGEEIVAKTYLKPKSHENPWRDDDFQEKELANTQKIRKSNGKCMIS